MCPSTDSTFDLRDGSIKEWFPKNPVLRVLTPPLGNLFVFPVKIEDDNIYISIGGSAPSDASAEIIFSGMSKPGITASDVNVDEVISISVINFLITSYLYGLILPKHNILSPLSVFFFP